MEQNSPLTHLASNLANHSSLSPSLSACEEEAIWYILCAACGQPWHDSIQGSPVLPLRSIQSLLMLCPTKATLREGGYRSAPPFCRSLFPPVCCLCHVASADRGLTLCLMCVTQISLILATAAVLCYLRATGAAPSAYLVHCP